MINGTKYEWTTKIGLSKFCGRQPLKNLLSPLSNALSQILNYEMSNQIIINPVS